MGKGEAVPECAVDSEWGSNSWSGGRGSSWKLTPRRQVHKSSQWSSYDKAEGKAWKGNDWQDTGSSWQGRDTWKSSGDGWKTAGVAWKKASRQKDGAQEQEQNEGASTDKAKPKSGTGQSEKWAPRAGRLASAEDGDAGSQYDGPQLPPPPPPPQGAEEDASAAKESATSGGGRAAKVVELKASASKNKAGVKIVAPVLTEDARRVEEERRRKRAARFEAPPPAAKTT